jgi:hypothetical protein
MNTTEVEDVQNSFYSVTVTEQPVLTTSPSEPQTTVYVTESPTGEAPKQKETSIIEIATMVMLPIIIILFFMVIIVAFSIQINNMVIWKSLTNVGGYLANYVVTFLFLLPLFLVGIVGILSVIPAFSPQTQIKLGTGYLLSLFVIITIEQILNTSFTVASYGPSYFIPTPMAFFLVIPSVIRILHLNRREFPDSSVISLAEKANMVAIPIITVLFFIWLVASEAAFIAQMALWKNTSGNATLTNYIFSFIFVLPLFLIGVVGITSVIPPFPDKLKLGLSLATLGALFVMYIIEVILVMSFAAGLGGVSFIMVDLMLLYMIGSHLIRAYFLSDRLNAAKNT